MQGKNGSLLHALEENGEGENLTESGIPRKRKIPAKSRRNQRIQKLLGHP